jgi:Permuted papain-like amidase enzyme, YaeF/YiiX, C92 family
MRAHRHTAALIALALLASDAQLEAARSAVETPPALAPGDVVFIAVDGAIWSQLASRWSSPQHRYGHVGIAAHAEDGALVVVHAGGSPLDGASLVRAEPYATFAAHADRVGLFRLRASAAARTAAGAAALAFAHRRITFDADFSLASADEHYCTELVWRAIAAGANLNAAPRPSTIAGRPAITLRDLETSAVLEEVSLSTASFSTKRSSRIGKRLPWQP